MGADHYANASPDARSAVIACSIWVLMWGPRRVARDLTPK